MGHVSMTTSPRTLFRHTYDLGPHLLQVMDCGVAVEACVPLRSDEKDNDYHAKGALYSRELRAGRNVKRDERAQRVANTRGRRPVSGVVCKRIEPVCDNAMVMIRKMM